MNRIKVRDQGLEVGGLKTRIKSLAHRVWSLGSIVFVFFSIVFAASHAYAFTLADIQRAYGSHKDFTVNFSQVTYQLVKGEEVHFEGKVMYKMPSHVRMDVFSPQRQIITLNKNQASIYLPIEDDFILQDIPEELAAQNVLGFIAGIDSIEKYYTTQIKDDSLILTPKKGQGSIIVQVDKSHLIKKIQTTDFIGNRIELTFTDYAFDQGLTNEAFSPKKNN